MIKSRRLRWAGHVPRMGEERGPYGPLVGKTEGERGGCIGSCWGNRRERDH